MKQFVVSIIAIACISTFALAGGQSKDEKDKKSSDAKSTKVTGEVVDVSCFLAHGDGGKGESHKSCGQACAKNGGPLGILTKDGTLYVSVLPDDHKNGPNAILIDHVAHTVVATGIVRTKGGTNGIMITKVEMPAEEEKK